MKTKYWITNASLFENAAPMLSIVSHFPIATRRYYGTVTLQRPLADPEPFGLVAYTDLTHGLEAEDAAVARAEACC